MEKMKQNKMGTEPIAKLVLTMSLPAMFSMLVQALYNIFDSMFVSWMGSEALSAISIAFPIQMVMIALGVGTGVGINSLVSRRLGEGRKKEAGLAAAHGLLLGVGNWVVMAAAGIFFAKPFFMMTTSNPAIIQMGTTYIRIVTIFSFGMFIQSCVEKTLQATGNMFYPMCSQLLGCITNIILDPILIFGLLGAPKLGMAGAAIATVIGQIFSMIFCLFIIIAKNHEITITLKGFRLKWEIIKDIYVVGVPAIIMQAITSVLVTFLNKILITFSESAVNVLGIYYKLQSFVFMPVFGLNQGVMPVMGYNYGAGNKKRLLDALKTGLICAVCIMFIGMVVFQVIPGELLSLFKANAQTLEIGIPAMKIISLCFVPAALGILFSTLFQAVGMGTKSLIVSLIRQLICILPVAYLLSKVSLTAVWYSFPIAEAVAFVISIVMFLKLNKKTLSALKPAGENNTL